MNDLELLREMFKDPRLHIGIGTITQLGLFSDGSTLRVMVNLLPENRELVAEMTFADVCMVTFPEVDDLALVVFVDGHPDEAFVIKTVNTVDELIPSFALTGNTAICPRSGKTVGISRSNVIPSEPLVLGNTLVSALNALANAFMNNASNLGTIPGVGTVVLNPSIVTLLQTFQTTYLTTSGTNILSQLALIERGI